MHSRRYSFVPIFLRRRLKHLIQPPDCEIFRNPHFHSSIEQLLYDSRNIFSRNFHASNFSAHYYRRTLCLRVDHDLVRHCRNRRIHRQRCGSSPLQFQSPARKNLVDRMRSIPRPRASHRQPARRIIPAPTAACSNRGVSNCSSVLPEQPARISPAADLLRARFFAAAQHNRVAVSAQAPPYQP